MEDRRPWVVVIWVETVKQAVDPHLTRVDLGERHKWKDVQVPRGCVWVRHGSAADVDSAKAWAATQAEDVQVLTLPATEEDPIGAAKRQVMGPA